MISERTLSLVAEPEIEEDGLWFDLGYSSKDPEEMYLCGECGLLLDRSLPAHALEKSVIRCPNCRALNMAVRHDG